MERVADHEGFLGSRDRFKVGCILSEFLADVGGSLRDNSFFGGGGVGIDRSDVHLSSLDVHWHPFSPEGNPVAMMALERLKKAHLAEHEMVESGLTLGGRISLKSALRWKAASGDSI